MLRISKLTDYGTVLLANLAANRDTVCSAADVANATGIAVPTVSKLLKSLGRSGLVTSTRGANGGYELARDPRDISAADIIDALEGPVSITECSAIDSQCEHEGVCSVGGAWQRVTLDGRDGVATDEDHELLALNTALEKLGALHERQARIVEMRYLAGMSVTEVACVLDVSRSTIEAEWRMARAWLHRELGGGGSATGESVQ